MPDSDTRFQFEIIKSLSESVKQLASNIADMQKTQVGMLERLAALESNRIGDTLQRLESTMTSQGVRVDNLERTRDQEEGARSVGEKVLRWWPVLAMLFTVLFLLFRATGILHLPDNPPVVLKQGEG